MLKKGKLYFYESQESYSKGLKPGKVVDLAKVTNVSFHYDPNAPKVSKKIAKADIDESRFDIYTEKRVFNLKTEPKSELSESNDWVFALKESA